jgi:hypothetical protein
VGNHRVIRDLGTVAIVVSLILIIFAGTWAGSLLCGIIGIGLRIEAAVRERAEHGA